MNKYECQRKKSKVATAMNVLLTFTVPQLTSTWCKSAVEKQSNAPKRSLGAQDRMKFLPVEYIL